MVKRPPGVVLILVLKQFYWYLPPQIYHVPMILLLHPTKKANSVPVLDCMSTNFNSIMHSVFFTCTFKTHIRTLNLYKNLYISYVFNGHWKMQMYASSLEYLTQFCVCVMLLTDFVSWRHVASVVNEWLVTRIISCATCVKLSTTWNVYL